ncbi:alpha-tocopherol transfer protein-like isoform X1 [Camponotus floridanus]|uniref:alpha-tocopherol transfer protein-like isoform X1 n=1 Tax=Camponotus floridanus TaxID=104421 RepID=UPI000DC668E0|nr:alpha-tocopherol transfer protein-like isoform X1 [Camponotus floridanus]XP_025262195.1 alpha-tocopherol transfer protein-like isoform X1 [Camponotus floridanus]XP_025262196.1 alpha-tocopherol transfer protein-like isoform X1 [Camponotus floridanus]XP_025262197.1 alpha-tocopherol transfer protein-like isoform X1 [Camponotus floridanus]XP_025262198.1 alpha-tocopherol transfer protein-like isoform X1 [Camponotus floridanus]XP_025262199.1 alpha-tocopherol transfer protein-like isoform X1 [Camp
MIKLEMPSFKEILKDTGGNEQLLEELLIKLRLWLKQQIHLPEDISEKRLKFYIYNAKFNLEKVKKRLDLHYTLRNLIPEVFTTRDPLAECVFKVNTYIQFVTLPILTPENYRITIMRWLHSDSSVFDLYDLIKYSSMIMETRIEEDIVNSDVIIYDCTNLTFGHVLKYTPVAVKKLDILLESYGSRMKAIYVINTPSFFDVLLTVVKSVMKAKLFNRIHLYTSGIESIYGIIPRSLLPVEYGGEQPSLNILSDMWKAKLIERREWFLKEEKVKVNESLRSNSVINPDDLFGVSGTFRKLDID